MEDSNPDLETFRQQWRAEVEGKNKVDGNTRKSKPGSNKQHARRQAFDDLPSQKGSRADDHEGHHESQNAGRRLSSNRRVVDPKLENDGGSSRQHSSTEEPKSALEHYEKAVERETQGKLGDSLDLYRKAFKLDDQVDKIYKKKHFPASSFPSKPAKVNPSNAAPTVPNTAHHSLEGPSKPINELIASFADLKIAAAPPAIEGTEPPPCPLADLPEEILIHIMTDLALLDVGSFTKTAQVCKKLAYVVMHEEQIWKKVCHSTTSGFPAMHYKWQREVMGGPLIEDVEEELDDNDPNSSTSITVPPTKEEVTESLYNEGYSSSWQRMFRHRPRIRFNGCYISTVNYMRAGQATQSSTTWGSPVHIVTYFRYLRFFRDGTVISLLTTVEPAEVVHNLTKELQKLHHKGSAAYLPTIFMQHVLKGRWRLSSIADDPEASLKDAEGDVYVETEGANEKYLYRMKFSLANAGKTVRNNKLNWQGFWCYNMLTDDTGEFPGKNDKAYHFSRVKSYGLGE